LDLRLTGRGFKCQPVRFHVTGQLNSALHHSKVAKSSTCFSWGWRQDSYLPSHCVIPYGTWVTLSGES